jgi:dTMP kinase
LDGSGKSTQAKLLAASLRRSRNVLCTAEPSRGKIGSFIRTRYLFEERRSSIAVEALLFAADRVDHVENEIVPALKEGRLVISDRYLFSSLAYQGAAGLDLNWIMKINQRAIRPDFAIFVDVDPAVVIGRLKRKKSVMEDLATQRKVHAVYQKYVDEGSLFRIDGNRPKKVVAKELLTAVLRFLEESRNSEASD